MSGKGSDSRPYSVSQQTFADNWSRTFGPSAEKPPEETASDSLALNFTGKAALILELADHAPMDLRFEDRDLVLALIRVILEHTNEPFEVLSADEADHDAQRRVLYGTSSDSNQAAASSIS
jgi:hypothetical protein